MFFSKKTKLVTRKKISQFIMNKKKNNSLISLFIEFVVYRNNIQGVKNILIGIAKTLGQKLETNQT